MAVIWQKAYFKEVLKVFGYFLIAFYSLYVLIDYASRASQFSSHHTSFSFLTVVIYYLAEFSLRADLLIPLGLLVATAYTLSRANQNNELLVLLASGVSPGTLFRPFLFIGLAGTLLLFFNAEMVAPLAARKMNEIQNVHRLAKRQKYNTPTVNHLVTEQGSTLLYMHFDRANETFHDLFWIEGMDRIHHIQTLHVGSIPQGEKVTLLERGQDGALIPKEFYETLSLPRLQFSNQFLQNATLLPDERSLSNLFEHVPSDRSSLNGKQAHLTTFFFYKLALPWLALLAVLIPIPPCMAISRTLPVFMIFASSLFSLIALYILLEALFSLGKRQTFPPAGVIWIPFSCLIFAILLRFWRWIPSPFTRKTG